MLAGSFGQTPLQHELNRRNNVTRDTVGGPSNIVLSHSRIRSTRYNAEKRATNRAHCDI
jgi:hypothetical protein